MMRFALASMMLLAAAPGWAQARDFRIGGEIFAEADIVDARAQPEIGGGAAILLSFEAPAAKRLTTVTAKFAGKPLPVTLEGETISSPTLAQAADGGALQISNAAWTTEGAAALAKKISGKDPLPESLEE